MPRSSPPTIAFPPFTSLCTPHLYMKLLLSQLPPATRDIPSREFLPATPACPRSPHRKALCLQTPRRPQEAGLRPLLSLRLRQGLQAKNQTLWKNSISAKAVHVHQSQYVVYLRTICHASGLVTNTPSSKYIPLGVRTVSFCI